MAKLDIRLFADFQVVFRGEPPIIVHQPRMQSLLAYLILHSDAPQTRQHLAYLLWPDTNDQQARTNLRNLIYRVRHCFPQLDAYLEINTQYLWWRPDADYQLDVAHFLAGCTIVDESTGPMETVQSALERAIGYYRGELLPMLYDEWVAAERELLRLRFLHALDRLIRVYEAQHNYSMAILNAQRLLANDPLREESCRTLMRLHALNDEKGNGIRVYQEFKLRLKRDLDVAPTGATQQEYQRLVEINAHDADSDCLAPTALTPFIGRDDERARLQALWRQAVNGKASTAIIAGEPGVGKTRLANELGQWVTRQGFATAWAQCDGVEGGPAYAPVVAWLHEAPLQHALSSLEDVWLEEVTRLLPELRIGHPDLKQPQMSIGTQQRQRLFDALTQLVQTARQPLLLVLENLHYCDTSTLEWLHYLLRSHSMSKILLVGTLCPCFASPDRFVVRWSLDLAERNQLTEIRLGRLDVQETAELAEAMLRGPLREDQIRDLFTETEGLPLYLVELLRAQISRTIPANVPPSNNRFKENPKSKIPYRLPARVRHMFELQLQELSPFAQHVASFGAVIGTEFALSTVLAVSDDSEIRVVQALDEACTRGILNETTIGEYAFTHHQMRHLIVSKLSMARCSLFCQRVAMAEQKPDGRARAYPFVAS